MQTEVTGQPELLELATEPWKERITAEILMRVQENILRYYPELAREKSARVVLSKPPQRRRFTFIFWLTIESPEGRPLKSMIAKAYRITPKKDARDQDIRYKSQREFLFHREVYDYFSAQAEVYSVVRPLDYFSDLLTLIVEKAEGKDLGVLIKETRYALNGYQTRKTRLGAYVQRCGKWLALMHRGFPVSDALLLEPDHFERQVNHYYKRFCKAGGETELADPLRQRILAVSRKFAGAEVAQAHLHGDFKLRHLFFTPERIIPIDFGNELSGAAYDDVARFLVELKLMEYGARLPLHGELMPYLQEQFLLGYLGSSTWPPLLRLYYVVWLWAKWDRRLKKLTTNKRVRKALDWMHASGVQRLLNHTYVNSWFKRELTSELTILEKEVDGDNHDGHHPPPSPAFRSLKA